MEYLLREGDYLPDETGGFLKARDADEVLQRAVFKLRARRGSFPLLPELGSRLYLLGRERPAGRQSAAEQYVLEALADEADIKVSAVELSQKGDELFVNVTAIYGGEEVSLGLKV